MCNILLLLIHILNKMYFALLNCEWEFFFIEIFCHECDFLERHMKQIDSSTEECANTKPYHRFDAQEFN